MAICYDRDYPTAIFFIDRPSCIQCPFGHIIGDFEAFECAKTGEIIKHKCGMNERGDKCPLEVE